MSGRMCGSAGAMDSLGANDSVGSRSVSVREVGLSVGDAWKWLG